MKREIWLSLAEKQQHSFSLITNFICEGQETQETEREGKRIQRIRTVTVDATYWSWRQRERETWKDIELSKEAEGLTVNCPFFKEIVSKGIWRPKIIKSAVNPGFRFKKKHQWITWVSWNWLVSCKFLSLTLLLSNNSNFHHFPLERKKTSKNVHINTHTAIETFHFQIYSGWYQYLQT